MKTFLLISIVALASCNDAPWPYKTDQDDTTSAKLVVDTLNSCSIEGCKPKIVQSIINNKN